MLTSVKTRLPRVLAIALTDTGFSDLFFNMAHDRYDHLFTDAAGKLSGPDPAEVNEALFEDALDLLVMLGLGREDKGLAQALVDDFNKRL